MQLRWKALMPLPPPLCTEMPRQESERLLNIEAEYHAALCAVYLYHKDAVWRIDQFVDRHPESTWVPGCNGNWATTSTGAKNGARLWMRSKGSIPADSASPCARNSISSVAMPASKATSKPPGGSAQGRRRRQCPPEYLEAARYYLAHIAYDKSRLTTALAAFEELLAVEAFRTAVPVYIAQILHQLQRHEDLVERAPTWLDDAADLRPSDRQELARLLGTAHFPLGICESGHPFLEAAWETMDSPQRTAEFSYIVGQCRLATGKPADAIRALMRSTGKKDSLDQFATHALGRAYLELGEKPKAQAAFAAAAELDYDLELREDALFNHAKLAFETDFNPFNDAIAAFEQYLEEYPDSPRATRPTGSSSMFT